MGNTVDQFNANSMHASTGGGRGRYDNAAGDFPICIQQPIMRHIINQQHDSTDSNDQSLEPAFADRQLHIIFKNVRSLKSDDRLAELLYEVSDTHWDILMINETWREEAQEYFKTAGGHIFAGSGGCAGKRGVAIVVHRRHASSITNFRAINERLCFISLRINQVRFRFVTAYFPHSGYVGSEVQKVYTALSGLRKDAKLKREMFVLGADFNAVVGQRNEHDSQTHIGMHGMGSENSRGQWLKQWSTLENLIITNTFFAKHAESKITHTGPNGNTRQIDFILVDKRLKVNMRDSCSIRCLDMGSDHRAVLLRMCFQCKTHAKKKTAKIHSQVNWKEVDTKRYLENASHILDDLVLQNGLEERCHQIEQALLEAGTLSREVREYDHGHVETDRSHLRQLTQQRRTLPHTSRARKELSKQIQKEITAVKRIERRSKIEKILNDFQSLKSISGIKSSKKKTYMTSMLDKNGEEQTERQHIADIFADFYEELYKSVETSGGTFTDDGSRIPSFTSEEVQQEIKQLKNNKCKDASGMVAEMLKCGGPNLVTILRDTYNQILSDNAEAPEVWKKTVFTVLHKSGDKRLPQNYRPIVIIPILYKLFARLLYKRLAPILDKAQCPDQAGFRHDYSTTDHLFTYSLLHEKTREHQLNLWLGAVDFKKAFDTISHSGLWEALSHQEVPSAYVRLLQQLYSGQSGQVRTDKLSRQFNIGRGTKQGDPLSSLLFNSILEHIMRKIKTNWQRKQYGIQMGAGDASRLNNLRFADDLLIVGRTQAQVATMLSDLHAAASEFGLMLHPDKTKIMTNATRKSGRGNSQHVLVGDMQISILPFDGDLKYLGRKLCFQDSQEVEVQNRIRAGWAKFMSHRQELTSKSYTLNSRLRLFDAVVSPTVLYGAATWTLTKGHEHILQRTQRRMLRMILGSGRRRQNLNTSVQDNDEHDTANEPADDPDLDCDVDSNVGELLENQLEDISEEDALEPWADWIKRVTHRVEEQVRKLNLQSWVVKARAAKWKWAFRVANHDANRWTRQVLDWDPELLFDGPRSRAQRKRGRPQLRWIDDIVQFTQYRHNILQWQQLATNAASWDELSDDFCNESWRNMPNSTQLI